MMSIDDLVSLLLPFLIIFVFFISMGILSILFIDVIRLHRKRNVLMQKAGNDPFSHSSPTPKASSTKDSAFMPPTAAVSEAGLETPDSISVEPLKEVSDPFTGSSAVNGGAAVPKKTGKLPSVGHALKGIGRLGRRRKNKNNPQSQSSSSKPEVQADIEEYLEQTIQPASPKSPEPQPSKMLPEPVPLAQAPKPDEVVAVEKPFVAPQKVEPAIPESKPTNAAVSGGAAAAVLFKQRAEPQQNAEESKQTEGEIKIKPIASLAEAQTIIKSKIKEKPAEVLKSSMPEEPVPSPNPNTVPSAPTPVAAPPVSAKPAASSTAAPDTDNVLELLGGGAKPKPSGAEFSIPTQTKKIEAEAKEGVPSPKGEAKAGSAIYVEVTSTKAPVEETSNDVPALLYTDSVTSLLTKQDVTGGVQNFSSQLNELRDTLSKLNKTLKKLNNDQESAEQAPAKVQGKEENAAPTPKVAT